MTVGAEAATDSAEMPAWVQAEFPAVIIDLPRYLSKRAKGGTQINECEFMIAVAPAALYALPKACSGLPVSNTAKVMYARLLE